MTKNRVYISIISWIDQEGSEAEILFKIGGREFWAFCHPCNFRVGEDVEACFNFIEEEVSENVYWGQNSQQKKEIVPSENHRWKYYCYGQIIGIHPVTIDCGVIVFCDENDWINDETVIGSFVYFVISRLDISRQRDCGL